MFNVENESVLYYGFLTIVKVKEGICQVKWKIIWVAPKHQEDEKKQRLMCLGTEIFDVSADKTR